MAKINHVVLKKIGTEHLEQTYKWLQNEKLRSLIDCSGAPTVEQNRQYWEGCLRDRTRVDCAIHDEDNQHIGNCGLFSINKKRGDCVIWVYRDPDKGKGLASIALGKLIDRAFNELELEKIYVRVLATNTVALHFYEKLGFNYNGLWDGDNISSVSYLLLKSRWTKKNRT